MTRAALYAGMKDELAKIAGVDLSGVSHDSVMQHMAPAGPMETSGLAKATSILARYQATQAPVKVAHDLALRQNSGHLTSKDPNDSPMVAQGKSLGGHALGGMAAGRLLSEFSFGSKIPNAAKKHARGWKAMAAGLALGGAEFARKKITKRIKDVREHDRKLAESLKKKSASVLSPGLALKASQQVGKIGTGVRKSIAPSLKTQNAGATLGRAFRP